MQAEINITLPRGTGAESHPCGTGRARSKGPTTTRMSASIRDPDETRRRSTGSRTHEARPDGGGGDERGEGDAGEDGEQDPVGGRGRGRPGVLERERGADGDREWVRLVERRGRAQHAVLAAVTAAPWGGEEGRGGGGALASRFVGEPEAQATASILACRIPKSPDQGSGSRERRGRGWVWPEEMSFVR